MSSARSLAELGEQPRAKAKEPRSCPRCGKPFVSYQKSRRKYCYRPECEDARVADHRELARLRAACKRRTNDKVGQRRGK